MPHSSKVGKQETVEWIKELSGISKIIDVGAGSGTYYKLLVESNNLLRNSAWTAIEAWKPNIDLYRLNSMYNTVINEDVRKLDWNMFNPVDLVIMGDVLEHMTKDESIKIVDGVMSVSRYGIISIPIKHWPQDAVGGNPFEIHVKDDWSHDEVMDTFGKYITKFRAKKIGVYFLENGRKDI